MFEVSREMHDAAANNAGASAGGNCHVNEARGAAVQPVELRGGPVAECRPVARPQDGGPKLGLAGWLASKAGVHPALQLLPSLGPQLVVDRRGR